jgi:CPA1 family monovalent cation:H+ antiporter
MVAAVSCALVVVRFLFLFVSVYTIRALDRRPQQRERRMGHRARVISALAGFRGAVSLALALSVPYTLDSGGPFPDRDTIVFVTAGVVVTTLVVQALALPSVARWAQLPYDTDADRELALARTTASQAALDALPTAAANLGIDPEVTEPTHRVRDPPEHAPGHRDGEHPGRRRARTTPRAGHRPAPGPPGTQTLRRHRLRDAHRIDDAVLQRVQAQLDVEEVRLAPAADPE